MTKAYQLMSVGDAFYTAARKYPGSVEAIAQRMGKSPKVLRSKLTPDDETHVLTLDEAIQIIELLDTTAPHAADLAIKALAYRLGRVVVRHSGVDSQETSLEVQALAFVGAVGLLSADVAVAVSSSQQPINKKQADGLSASIARCLDALFVLKDGIERSLEQ